jgi:hypothetical protein
MHSAKENKTARMTVTQTRITTDWEFPWRAAAQAFDKAESERTGENAVKNIPASPIKLTRGFILTFGRNALSVFEMPTI